MLSILLPSHPVAVGLPRDVDGCHHSKSAKQGSADQLTERQHQDAHEKSEERKAQVGPDIVPARCVRCRRGPDVSVNCKAQVYLIELLRQRTPKLVKDGIEIPPGKAERDNGGHEQERIGIHLQFEREIADLKQI